LITEDRWNDTTHLRLAGVAPDYPLTRDIDD
jgi:hypothetical protein